MHRLSTSRLRRHPLLAGSLIVLAVLAILSQLYADRQIVVNTSLSVPPGLYVRSAIEPRVGALVEFRIPPAARGYVRARTGYDGEDWYILKPVAAGPGDRVCTAGDQLTINGRWTAPMPPSQDNAGRSLPVWRADRTLQDDEFFVFSGRIPNSFDSRCYGPVCRWQVEAVRRPLMTW